jgi:hypothetical protein
MVVGDLRLSAPIPWRARVASKRGLDDDSDAAPIVQL